MNRWLRIIEDILWPQRFKCLCCDELSEGELLCPDCRQALKAVKLSPTESGGESIRSVYRYDGVAKQLVLLLKEQCVAAAANVLADGMAEAASAMELPADIVLTWVSMPDIRRMKRGIDHGRILCEAVGSRTGFPVKQLLVRTGRLHTQRGLSREARLRNLSGTLACPSKINGPVLLIDDVLTTGATASACAEVLMRAGAEAVFVLTATRAMLRSSTNDQKG